MLIVSNALLMSSAIVNVRSAGLVWLNSIVIVFLFMLYSDVFIEWLLLKPCCIG